MLAWSLGWQESATLLGVTPGGSCWKLLQVAVLVLLFGMMMMGTLMMLILLPVTLLVSPEIGDLQNLQGNKWHIVLAETGHFPSVLYPVFWVTLPR